MFPQERASGLEGDTDKRMQIRGTNLALRFGCAGISETCWRDVT